MQGIDQTNGQEALYGDWNVKMIKRQTNAIYIFIIWLIFSDCFIIMRWTKESKNH